ncbi:GNAT family N-acetyltransferase [Agrobacterium sp. 22-226-1]
MQLRIAKLSDATAVTTLLERAYPTLMAASYNTAVLALALPLMTKSNPTLLASETYYVVEDNGRLVGCGGWTPERPGTGEVKPGVAHLRHFASDPDQARQGIGRLIYNQCVTDATDRGVVRFQVFAALNAETFYQRLGLRRISVINLVMGPSITLPTILMEGPVALSL